MLIGASVRTAVDLSSTMTPAVDRAGILIKDLRKEVCSNGTF